MEEISCWEVLYMWCVCVLVEANGCLSVCEAKCTRLRKSGDHLGLWPSLSHQLSSPATPSGFPIYGALLLLWHLFKSGVSITGRPWRWLEQAAVPWRRAQAVRLRQAAPPPAVSCGKSIFSVLFQWGKHKNIFGDPSLPLVAAKISAFGSGGPASLETQIALIKTFLFKKVNWNTTSIQKSVHYRVLFDEFLQTHSCN